jgi:uncharacterized membrane protein YfcA
MNALAVLGAIAIGLTLGLLGSGGSILTVPVLVFVLGQPEKIAIASSLAIVGAIALVAALPYARKSAIDWRSVLLFGLPGMAGTIVGSAASRFVSGSVQLLVFALVMLAAAWTMARARAPEPRADPRAAWKIGADGAGVGLLTGMVGVGGGFMIVPALVLLGGLSMQRAIGTSLAIIVLNCAVGFWRHSLELSSMLDWTVIATFALIGAAGSLVGGVLGGRLPQAPLKRGFAAFLVLMAAYIVWRTLPGLL